MPRRTHHRLVLLLAFLSGGAALVYQVLWLKELTLLFGSTAHATATVLAVFFLGLAAGGAFWGNRAPRFARPLAALAGLEVGIAGAAVFYLLLLDGYQLVYGALFARFAGAPALFVAVKLLLALVLLLPASFLMGGTLPLLGEQLVRRPRELGTVASRLYQVNTAGAVLGAAAAGFVLPLALGFHGAYALAATVNLAVAGGALLLARRGPAPAGEAAPGGSPDAGSDPIPAGPAVLPPWALWAVAFLSGFLTLGLEVLWTRMFAQVLQNSVYSFATILVTFLLALVAGAGVAHRLSRRPGSPVGPLVWLLAGTGLGVAASPWIFFHLTGGLSYLGSGEGFAAYLATVFAYAGLVMLVPGTLAGSIFPYLFHLGEARSWPPGVAIGRLLAVNTVGAISGSLAAGFLVLPALGLWRAIATTAAAYLLAALAVALAGPSRRPVSTVVVAAGLGAVLLTSLFLRLPTIRLGEGEELVELTHGSYGTVAVVRRDGHLEIRVNNYYTLGSAATVESERRQAHLPLLLHPEPRSVFFLGLGTSITAGAALEHPVERVVAAEIVPEVAGAARRWFGELNHRLFEDPRVTVVTEDGRNVLAGTRESFDVIVGDLFIPWSRGTGNLYTREHFETVRARLTPDGLFAQWLPLYQLSRDELAVITRTFREVFEETTLWRGDFFAEEPIVALVGRRRARPLDPAALEAARRRLGPEAGLLAEEGPLLYYAGNPGAARHLFADAPVNTDDRPLVEYRAPITHRRARAQRTSWVVGEQLMALLDRLLEAVPPARDPVLTRTGAAGRARVEAGFLLHRARVHRSAGRDVASARDLARAEALLAGREPPEP